MKRNSKPERWILLPDLHAPFHNQICVNKITRFIRDLKPHGVVIMGDFLDNYSLARWNENSLSRLKDINLSLEYEAGRQVLAQLESALPRGAKRHYLYGNHGDRYIR